LETQVANRRRSRGGGLPSLGESTLEITVLSAFANSLVTEGIAKGVLTALDADGATELEEVGLDGETPT
jgi:hypothetical protein